MAAGDLPAVRGLLASSLGWEDDDAHAEFFAWKHLDNPFGPSPGLVAIDGARLIGFRTFLRWEFEGPSGDAIRAARAVDTATHPDARGRGVFTSLTMQALDELRADGTRFVFNTPNSQSRPGYLKMGWVEVGRLPAAVRPAGLSGIARMARSRTAAERWGVPTAVGEAAADVLGDEAALSALAASLPRPSGLRTRRSPSYWRWRYAGLPDLRYRVLLAGDAIGDGFAAFRLRRRGAATEAVIAEIALPEGATRGDARRLIRRILRASGADHALSLGPGRHGISVPSLGPILTWRSVLDEDAPALDAWALSMSEVELF